VVDSAALEILIAYVTHNFLRAGIAATLLALAACGGGSGEQAPPTGLQPTLASIQDNIFTPTCAKTTCHTGAGAMLNLRLDPGFSYASLVNVDSFYGMGIKRVIPGDSDNSFLIQKLGTNPMFGGRMPLDGPPFLQQVTVDVIRTWIENGAQP
jgi:hypothetical protein